MTKSLQFTLPQSECSALADIADSTDLTTRELCRIATRKLIAEFRQDGQIVVPGVDSRIVEAKAVASA